MGLEILEEFRPVTPIRTLPSVAKAFNHHTELSAETTRDEILQSNGEDQECVTPRSPSRTLKTPLVCPRAPKKPRVTARRKLAPPPQGFFQVPHRDLSSFFVLHTKPFKKIKASS